jgi:hypothetical protein
MTNVDDIPASIDDFMVVIDNENARVILQFVADVSTMRTPMALVLDTPNAPMSLEDEKGMIATFAKPVNEEEFLTLSLAGETTLAMISPKGQKITECWNVPVIGKMNIVQQS